MCQDSSSRAFWLVLDASLMRWCFDTGIEPERVDTADLQSQFPGASPLLKPDLGSPPSRVIVISP